MSDSFEYYWSLRYPIEFVEDPEGGFVARHPDLEGCMAQGETADAAVAALAVARRLWLQVRVEDGLPIPEPVEDDQFGGRFLLRLPRSLHGRLARRAAKDGVSLNQYIGFVLAEHLGEATKTARAADLAAQLSAVVEELRSQAPSPQTRSVLPWSTMMPVFPTQFIVAGQPTVLIAPAETTVNERPSEQRWADANLEQGYPPQLKVVGKGERS